MLEWIPWLWLGPTILFSFIGQGIISFLLVRLVYNKWFLTPDSKDLHIQFLLQKIEVLESERERLTVENGKLITMIVQSSINSQ